MASKPSASRLARDQGAYLVPFCYHELMNEPETDSLHNELAALLQARDASCNNSAAADPTFRIERTFRQTDVETTQLVWFRGADGSELGPFVRKVIKDGSGLGAAYQKLADAQREGLRLRHVPRVYSCTHVDNSLVIVLEYIPGPTLREVVDRTDPSQRFELAARLMPALCSAVSELHEAFDPPLIHRDITPANIICPKGTPDEVVLIDFGIARVWNDHADSDTVHFGTRAYAPPEQFGFGQTDVRSDMYELGMVAFFCLTGRDPKPSDREHGFAAPEVNEPWRQAIAKAAEYDPQRRYPSARALCNAFTAAANTDGRRNVQQSTSRTGLGTGGAIPCASHKSLGQALLALALHVPHGVGKVWNGLVVAVAGLMALASLWLGITMGQHPSTNAFVVDAFGYFIYMPVLFLTVGYALLDRRRLRQRYPALAKRSVATEWRICALLIIVLTAILIAITAITM